VVFEDPGRQPVVVDVPAGQDAWSVTVTVLTYEVTAVD
jgi:hypothetical protein